MAPSILPSLLVKTTPYPDLRADMQSLLPDKDAAVREARHDLWFNLGRGVIKYAVLKRLREIIPARHAPNPRWRKKAREMRSLQSKTSGHYFPETL
jgi:hypothetical protein